MVNSIVWHYTNALGFMGISDRWEVRVSTTDVPDSEIPVAWFSSNQMIEKTIVETAWSRSDGSMIRPKNAKEYRILGMGLYRVGVPMAQTTRYADLLKKAKIGLVRRKTLEKTAKTVGATPFEWYGVLSSVTIDDDACIQTFDGEKWIMLPRASAKEFILQEQKATEPLLLSMLNGRRSDPLPSKSEILF